MKVPSYQEVHRKWHGGIEKMTTLEWLIVQWAPDDHEDHFVEELTTLLNEVEAESQPS